MFFLYEGFVEIKNTYFTPKHTHKHNFTVTVQSAQIYSYQSIVFLVVILNVQFNIRIQLL